MPRRGVVRTLTKILPDDRSAFLKGARRDKLLEMQETSFDELTHLLIAQRLRSIEPLSWSEVLVPAHSVALATAANARSTASDEAGTKGRRTAAEEIKP